MNIMFHPFFINITLSLLLAFAIPIKCKIHADELSRRPESFFAIPAQTSSVTQKNDNALVARLIEAYQLISKEKEQRGNSMWQAFFDQRHQSIHNTFKNGKLDEVAGILRNPGASDLFYGFDNLTASILSEFDSPGFQQLYATSCLDHLVRFAESIGAIPLDCPESYSFVSPIRWEADIVINIINNKLGVPITFPNPFPFEHGLLTSFGVMSYRVPQALYQAYRIKQILKTVDNPKVLEIGAGLGRTAYYARLLGIQDYTIVDLPLSIMSSGYFLGTLFGADQIIFSGETVFDAKNRIKMLSPAEFLANNEYYDLIINADGFTEMDPSIAKAYWDHIQKHTPIFLSINHEYNPFSVRTLIESSDFAIEVKRYPYWMRQGYVEEIIRFK